MPGQGVDLPTGLIPAHAGSTATPSSNSRITSAHPRSRGEHLPSAQDLVKLQGSSPLTRGALVGQVLHRELRGLIPAHAGSTMMTYPEWKIATAHPRSRGEHLRGGRALRCAEGSSPLTRGAPGSVTEEPLVGGLIPAHAGSTTDRHHRRPRRRAHPRSRGEHESNPSASTAPGGSSPLTRGALGQR